MPKNILVFLDGTRNKPSDETRRRATNVWKLYQAAAAVQHGHEPLAIYLRGVGTLPEPVKQQAAADKNFRRLRQWLPAAGPAARATHKLLQLPKRIALRYGAAAVGWGVADRIREGYASTGTPGVACPTDGATSPPADSLLMRVASRPNVIVTPHVAWASDKTQQALTDQLIDHIGKFAAGRPTNLVVEAG